MDESKWTIFLQRKCLKFKQKGRKRWVGDQTWPISQGLEWGFGSTLRRQPPAPRVGWEVREAGGPPDDAPEECLGRGCPTGEHLQEGGGNCLQLRHWGADREGMAAIAISLSSWLFQRALLKSKSVLTLSRKRACTNKTDLRQASC